MQTTTLGRTGLTVSVAGLGCGGHSRLGQTQGASFEHSVDIVRTALDRGVTFIDTAEAYGTEEIVAEAIRGRRDEVVISTKAGIHAESFWDLTKMTRADVLEERLDGCLRRLGVDCIDVFHLHGIAAAQYDYAVSEFVPCLKRMREKGKIRFTGVTERFGGETGHAMSARAAADEYFDVMMIGLNYLNQTAIKSVLPVTAKNNIATLCMFAVRGPLANREKVEALLHKLVETGEVDPASFDADDPLGFMLESGTASSMSEIGYRFCRHTPGIDVTMTGTGNRDHLLENIEAIDGAPLPGEVRDRLVRIFGAVTSESGEPPRKSG